jgi:hypothetical protein
MPHASLADHLCLTRHPPAAAIKLSRTLDVALDEPWVTCQHHIKLEDVNPFMRSDKSFLVGGAQNQPAIAALCNMYTVPIAVQQKLHIRSTFGRTEEMQRLSRAALRLALDHGDKISELKTALGHYRAGQAEKKFVAPKRTFGRTEEPCRGRSREVSSIRVEAAQCQTPPRRHRRA